MSRVAPCIELSVDEERALRRIVRASSSEQRMVERASIVLMANAGKSNQDIAATLGTRRATVGKWRSRFARDRLDRGLLDASRPGEFAAKAADVVGLCLNPPENALILSVDEKPSIQALERAQGWIGRRQLSWRPGQD